MTAFVGRQPSIEARWIQWTLVLAGAGTVGIAASPYAERLHGFGLAAIGVTALLTALPFAMRHWWFGTALFMAWLPFEDLVRKYSGNDLRIYVAKDLLFGLAIVGAGKHLYATKAWTRALSETRTPLYLLLAWVVLRTATSDVGLTQGIVGLRLDFLYLPLVALGYLFGLDERRSRRLLRLTCLLGAFVLVFGILQAMIGPGFLTPEEQSGASFRSSGFRDNPGPTGGQVLAPNGTFVDPGRYAQLVLLTGSGVVALWGLRERRRGVLLISGVVTTAALWASSSRASLVLLTAVICVSLVVQPKMNVADAIRRLAGAGALAVVSVFIAAALFPTHFGTTQAWFASALNPTNQGNEWTLRWNSYTSSVGTGINRGGLVGRGTGDQSLGQQYLTGSDELVIELESGYGAVASEWGVLGLCLWVVWIIAWVRRLSRSVSAAKSTPWFRPALSIATWIIMVLVVEFYGGFQFFQNYYINAYLWLFAGFVFGLGDRAIVATGGQRTDLVSASA